jgi:hypothetical protein
MCPGRIVESRRRNTLKELSSFQLQRVLSEPENVKSIEQGNVEVVSPARLVGESNSTNISERDGSSIAVIVCGGDSTAYSGNTCRILLFAL